VDLKGSPLVLQKIIKDVDVELLRWLLAWNFVVPERHLVNFNSRNVLIKSILNKTTEYLLYKFLFYGNNAGTQHRKKGMYAYIINHCARINIKIIALEFYEAIQNDIVNDIKVTLVHGEGFRETEISTSCIR
jgi:hypothetical protein